MTNAAGGKRGYRFWLQAAERESLRIGGESSFNSTQAGYLDADRDIYDIAGAVDGDQFTVSLMQQKLGDHPEDALLPVAFESSDESVATVAGDGQVAYVGDGDVTITARPQATSTGDAAPFSINLTLGSSVVPSAQSVEYDLDPTTAADHILVLYNDDSLLSRTHKDYYLANRPGMSGANTLGLTGVSVVAEAILTPDFDTLIGDPIEAWLAANPSKLIRYIVVCSNIPTRVFVPTAAGNFPSFQYGSLCFAINRLLSMRSSLRKPITDVDVAPASYALSGEGQSLAEINDPFSLAKYRQDTALVTVLPGLTQADRYAYIDKIAAKWSSGLEISGGNAVQRIVIDDHRDNAAGFPNITQYGPGSKSLIESFLADPLISYSSGVGGSYLNNLADVAFYSSWGSNGPLGNPPTSSWWTDGSLVFTGASDWWIGRTVESFNGQLSSWQESIWRSFNATACGGTAYANCPVGMVGHTEEPSAGGVNRAEMAVMWFSGRPFIECAWRSRRTPYFLCMGDPLVTI